MPDEDNLNCPFSDAILALVAQIRDSPSSGERVNLMMMLASQFSNEHDPTDGEAGDAYHSYFEEYQNARLRFQQAAIRIGRLAMREVWDYFDEEGVPLPVSDKISASN